MLVVFYFMLIGSIVGFIGMLFHFEIPTLMEFVYLILVGITTQLGQINMTRTSSRSTGQSVYSSIHRNCVRSYFWCFTVRRNLHRVDAFWYCYNCCKCGYQCTTC